MSFALPFVEKKFWSQLRADARFAGNTPAPQFAIAGRRVTIRLADPHLEPLLHPLAACRSIQRTCEPAALTIFAWTTRDADEWRALAATFNDAQHRLTATNSASGPSVHFDAEHQLLCVYDRQAASAAFVLPDASCLPFWEWAAPFRLIFHWWSANYAGQLTHAAAVGRYGRGVLLVGPGGSGKSTTAVAALDAGLDYISDDYTLVTIAPNPVAERLYGSAKMRTEFLPTALPGWSLRAVRTIGPERKSMFLVDQFAATQLVSRLELTALCVPRIADRESAAVEPLAAKNALLALAPSSLYQLPGARRPAFEFLRRLVQSLPAYTLWLGRDVASGPRALAGLLDSTNNRCASYAA